jgi:putative copper export protein
MNNTAQLTSAIDSIRLSLHIFGACIWVGGQFTLAALVPLLKKFNPEAPRIAAKGFNKIGWAAFAALIVTGMWNMADVPDDASAGYQRVLGAKMMIVILSGVAAFVHTKAKTSKSIAMWGSISGVTALLAMYLGVLLAG